MQREGTLNRIRDRMSSTKAAVMIACPKFSFKTRPPQQPQSDANTSWRQSSARGHPCREDGESESHGK